jgi:small-conductance mechanosensitive channel
LRRLKFAFDRAGIEIPFPQLTMHVPALNANNAGLAPAPARSSAAA